MDTKLAMSVVMGIVVLMVAMKGERVEGQGSTDCISKITPCANYITTNTTPPSTCCTPLLEVIKNDVQCLCNALNSGLIGNLSLQQALLVPERCGGQAVSTSACSGSGAPTSTPVGNPPPGQSSSTTMNSGAAISISTLIAMTLLAFLQGFQ